MLIEKKIATRDPEYVKHSPWNILGHMNGML